ncbi:unnamed protein product [Adineta ricciae]|uniref:Arginyl-tRNA--protein transferase 1 n=1 Tax=Adineta ricciae TaxID=249248 RepID=A0A814YJC5_ADIRI|nr:unnamed protein product [Adineta ricciae]
MASNRQSTATTVQIAFDSDPEPHHCGYCNTNGSCTAGLYNLSTITLRKVRSSNCGYCQKEGGKISFGIVASTMLVDDYQILMDRGWRKCGTYYYKALMKTTCCPLYTIRCDVNNFQISRSQRRVVQTMNHFINENIKPSDQTRTTTITDSSFGQSAPKKQNDVQSKLSLNDWINKQSNTNAVQLIRHVLTNDTPPSDEFLKCLRSRQKRWYKKLLKLKSQNKLSSETDIRALVKRFDRMDNHSPQILEEILQFNEKSVNKLEVRLVRSYPPSEEFTRTLTESHSVYQRYQMAIHGDASSACSFSQFKRFLSESSLKKDCPRIPSSKVPSCGYGSFHMLYYLNGKIIACNVLDILPGGISSVYFYYDPDLGFLKLGVYSALKEIELTRRLAREVPEIKDYYLGYYVHTCVKMRYKGQYKPSYLLCPETYTWHRIEKCVPLLNANKYARFESDAEKVDEDEENSIEHLKLRVDGRIITPLELQQWNEEYFFYILDRFTMLAKFVGKTCANRLVIDLN